VTARACSDDFDAARNETVRYHEELYATTPVGKAGTWLAEPHSLLHDALVRLPHGRPVTAYDLGAGIGRHTLPMLNKLPDGSAVYAVDLLQSALDEVDSAAPGRRTITLRTECADLADFEFGTTADLVFIFSAIEHLPGEKHIRALLEQTHAATNPGGVIAIGIEADRFEECRDGTRRPALLESELSASAAHHLLLDVFGDFAIDYLRSSPTAVVEERDGERYTLRSSLVTFLARRPTAAATDVVPQRRAGSQDRAATVSAPADRVDGLAPRGRGTGDEDG
jgi:tellurite methyltransferase